MNSGRPDQGPAGIFCEGGVAPFARRLNARLENGKGNGCPGEGSSYRAAATTIRTRPPWLSVLSYQAVRA